MDARAYASYAYVDSKYAQYIFRVVRPLISYIFRQFYCLITSFCIFSKDVTGLMFCPTTIFKITMCATEFSCRKSYVCLNVVVKNLSTKTAFIGFPYTYLHPLCIRISVLRLPADLRRAKKIGHCS